MHECLHVAVLLLLCRCASGKLVVACIVDNKRENTSYTKAGMAQNAASHVTHQGHSSSKSNSCLRRENHSRRCTCMYVCTRWGACACACAHTWSLSFSLLQDSPPPAHPHPSPYVFIFLCIYLYVCARVCERKIGREKHEYV
jgi:hypothetical protein